jgi:hypothetical protein
MNATILSSITEEMPVVGVEDDITNVLLSSELLGAEELRNGSKTIDPALLSTPPASPTVISHDHASRDAYFVVTIFAGATHIRIEVASNGRDSYDFRPHL